MPTWGITYTYPARDKHSRIFKKTCQIMAVIFSTKFPPGPNVIKLFTAVIYEFTFETTVFLPGRSLQPRLMFLALPTNTRLYWKGFPGTNAPAYYEN
jgi:hypothetical protein